MKYLLFILIIYCSCTMRCSRGYTSCVNVIDTTLGEVEITIPDCYRIYADTPTQRNTCILKCDSLRFMYSVDGMASLSMLKAALENTSLDLIIVDTLKGHIIKLIASYTKDNGTGLAMYYVDTKPVWWETGKDTANQCQYRWILIMVTPEEVSLNKAEADIFLNLFKNSRLRSTYDCWDDKPKIDKSANPPARL